MSILVDESTKLVVQGITGREGTFHTLRNKARLPMSQAKTRCSASRVRWRWIMLPKAFAPTVSVLVQ